MKKIIVQKAMNTVARYDFKYKGLIKNAMKSIPISNGVNLMMTITKALVQENDEKIFLLPAWHKKLDVSFRLPVGNNFINVNYNKGKNPEYFFDKPEKRQVVIM